MHAPRGPHMRVDVDISGHDRLAGDIDDLCAGGNVHLPLRADRDDPVVLHDDVALLNDLLAGAMHRQDARAAKRDRPLRLILRHIDHDVVPRCLVDRTGRRPSTRATESRTAVSAAARSYVNSEWPSA